MASHARTSNVVAALSGVQAELASTGIGTYGSWDPVGGPPPDPQRAYQEHWPHHSPGYFPAISLPTVPIRLRSHLCSLA